MSDNGAINLIHYFHCVAGDCFTRLVTRTKESGTMARISDEIVISKAKASGVLFPPLRCVFTERESYFWDPKDCELYPNWLKSGETLMEDLVTMLTCKSLV